MPIHKFIKPKSKGAATLVRFSGIGLQMGLTIYLLNLLGKYLNDKYPVSWINWESSLTLFAVLASTYSIIKQVSKMGKDADKLDKELKNEN